MGTIIRAIPKSKTARKGEPSHSFKHTELWNIRISEGLEHATYIYIIISIMCIFDWFHYIALCFIIYSMIFLQIMASSDILGKPQTKSH